MQVAWSSPQDNGVTRLWRNIEQLKLYDFIEYDELQYYHQYVVEVSQYDEQDELISTWRISRENLKYEVSREGQEFQDLDIDDLTDLVNEFIASSDKVKSRVYMNAEEMCSSGYFWSLEEKNQRLKAQRMKIADTTRKRTKQIWG